MAAHGHSSVVSQLASNISLRENTTCRFRPSVSLRGSPKHRVQLKICRLSQGLKNDLNLGFALAFRSRHRKLTSSQGTTKLNTRCEYGSKGGGDDSVGGDARVQQMLVEMVQIQIGKSRMSDFVDERSQHMRNIAQDTFDQYDRIAYRTMKGLDASGSRVLRQLDADAQAIERELKIARAELEAQEDDFEAYQQIVAYSRNEGLFFKNLYPAPKQFRRQTTGLSRMPVKENMVIGRPSQDSSSSYRQVLYGGLSLVIVSFIWSSSSAMMAGTMMRASKLASYGVIFSALLTQLAFAKVLMGEDDEAEGPIDVTNSKD